MNLNPAAISTEVNQVRLLARQEIVEAANQTINHRINRDLLKAFHTSGLLASLYPTTFGGKLDRPVSARRLCVVREGLGSESIDAENALAAQTLGSYPILLSGTAELAKRWIPAIIRGDAAAGFALSEPASGTDAAALELRADPVGTRYRLTGHKRWISMAPEADVYIVFARTSSEPRSKGVSAFVVPGSSRGLSGKPIFLSSGLPWGQLDFDGVEVSRAQMLGEPGKGFTVAMRTLDLFRPSVGAFACGLAQAALELAIDYADRRMTFGIPIRQNQAVSHPIANAATDIEAARLLSYRAALEYDNGGHRITELAAMSKLLATETARRVVDIAIQVHGAVAINSEHRLDRMYRAIRASTIYEGTSEIQREIIVRRIYGKQAALTQADPVENLET